MPEETMDSPVIYTQSPTKIIKKADMGIETIMGDYKAGIEDMPIATQTTIKEQNGLNELPIGTQTTLKQRPKASGLKIESINDITITPAKNSSKLPIIKEESKDEIKDDENQIPTISIKKESPKADSLIKPIATELENAKVEISSKTDADMDEDARQIKAKLDLDPNDGDLELAQFLDPLIKNAGSKPELLNDYSGIEGTNSLYAGITGVRLWNALHAEQWRLREASSSAFLHYLETHKLSKRLKYQSLPLFKTAIVVAKKACEDKLLQIYFVGLKILQEAMLPPVRGKDVTAAMVNKSIKPFVHMQINKISELNNKARELSLNSLINLFKTKAPDIRILIEAMMEFPEQTTVDKMPWRILNARLEILIKLLASIGYSKDWDWREICDKLVFPCLSHTNIDVRSAAIDLVDNMAKIIGQDLKKEVVKLELKLQTQQMLFPKLGIELPQSPSKSGSPAKPHKA